MNLSELNGRLKRTSIKGREYVEVNQRILGFREMYPEGRIVTEKTFDDGKRCDFRAEAWDGERLVATGHAFEFQSAGMVNKTSYVENCETSAVGRALGMLGIGIAESIASADEVMAAIGHQERGESPEPPSRAAGGRKRFARVTELKRDALDAGIDEGCIKEWLAAKFGKPMSEFNDGEVSQVEEHLESLIAAWRRLNGRIGAYAEKDGKEPEAVLADLKANREWESRHGDPAWLDAWAAKFERWAASDG